MEIEFRDDKIYLSDDIGFKPGELVFTFKLKGEPRFGFHKATKAQADHIVCDQVRRSANGKLYFTPVINPVRYMAAVMRLSFKSRKKLKVRKLPLNETDLFIIYGRRNRHTS